MIALALTLATSFSIDLEVQRVAPDLEVERVQTRAPRGCALISLESRALVVGKQRVRLAGKDARGKTCTGHATLTLRPTKSVKGVRERAKTRAKIATPFVVRNVAITVRHGDLAVVVTGKSAPCLKKSPGLLCAVLRSGARVQGRPHPDLENHIVVDDNLPPPSRHPSK